MPYRIDPYDNALVIDGWENGIAPNPYEGISDARNVLINSVPGDAGVGFSTGSLSLTVSVGTVTSVSGNTLTFTGATELPASANGWAVTFGTTSGYSGFSAGTTVYWIIKQAANTFNLYSDFTVSTQVSVTGSGNANFTVINPDFSGYKGNVPIRFCRSQQSPGETYLLDSAGRVWTNRSVTSPGSYWRTIGNAPHTQAFIGDTSSGNGIVYYQTSNSAIGYVFIWSDSSIDWFQVGAAPTINYGWNPATASNNNAAGYLNTGSASGASHEALVGQDNVVYFCDGSFIGSFFEKNGSGPMLPGTGSTFTPAAKALGLPTIDSANCLAELGTNLLIGGTRNLIYPWDRQQHIVGNSINSSFSYPIWLTESVVQKMITVNTNTFIFVGNRGRIHITNGSQAQEWFKMPDHLSGTLEPYYMWGGVASAKNQLYFSVAATNNDGTANTNYGGIWAIDLQRKNLRLVNQLSYGSYAGLATALYAIVPLYAGGAKLVGDPSGAGLYMGWDSGNVVNSAFSGGSSGIDGTTANPYTNSAAYVDSELIPLGTADKPLNFNRIEYLLTKPMVAGESIKLSYRTDFSQSYTTIATDSTTGNFFSSFPLNFSNVRWIQIRATLNSTTSSPSYVRLKHIRLTNSQQNG